MAWYKFSDSRCYNMCLDIYTVQTMYSEWLVWQKKATIPEGKLMQCNWSTGQLSSENQLNLIGHDIVGV